MNDDAPHILVVDDDDRLRDLLKQYLAGNGYRVTAAGDAAQARARLHGMAFDLIVLDVMMPGEDGLSLTASLKEESDTPILLLTARSEPEDRIDGLERGADDYLAKPFEPRELVLRISNLLRRAQRTMPAAVLRLGERRFDVERTELTRNDLPVRLTPAEGRLLQALARRPGVTLSRDVLVAESRIEGNARTVDVQVTRLRRKIEPRPAIPALPADSPRRGLRAAARLTAMFALLKRFAPRTLIGRSVTILVTPMIVVQVVATWAFYDRHWDIVTKRLVSTVAGDIAMVIDGMEAFPGEDNRVAVLRVSETAGLRSSFAAGASLPGEAPVIGSGILDRRLSRALTRKLGRPYHMETEGYGDWIRIKVQAHRRAPRRVRQEAAAVQRNDLSVPRLA